MPLDVLYTGLECKVLKDASSGCSTSQLMEIKIEILGVAGMGSIEGYKADDGMCGERCFGPFL